MKKWIYFLRSHWHGVVLGVITTFSVSVPAMADTADVTDVMKIGLPAIVIGASVFGAIFSAKNHNYKGMAKGLLVAFITLVAAYYLVDII